MKYYKCILFIILLSVSLMIKPSISYSQVVIKSISLSGLPVGISPNGTDSLFDARILVVLSDSAILDMYKIEISVGDQSGLSDVFSKNIIADVSVPAALPVDIQIMEGKFDWYLGEMLIRPGLYFKITIKDMQLNIITEYEQQL